MSLTGYSRTCELGSGGAKKFYAAIVADVTSFNFADPVYDAVTMVSGKSFHEYQFDPDSFEVKESETIENRCKKVVHTIEFYVGKMSAGSRAMFQELLDASDCGLIAIVEDNNGLKWVVGYSQNHLKTRALELKSGVQTSGKKLTDQNGLTVTLESEDTDAMRLLTASIPVTSLPTVTTTAITSIAATTAVGGGNVTHDGDLTITARGICWGETTDPTTAGSKDVDEAPGTGSFVSALVSLEAVHTYYVRAYATNSVGTAYGANVTFNTTA
jgi:hypothetical protein